MGFVLVHGMVMSAAGQKVQANLSIFLWLPQSGDSEKRTDNCFPFFNHDRFTVQIDITVTVFTAIYFFFF